jgi:hypothetical protein
MHTQFLKKKVKGTDHSVGLGMDVTINKEGLYWVYGKQVPNSPKVKQSRHRPGVAQMVPGS